jgi:uncharacterized protein
MAGPPSQPGSARCGRSQGRCAGGGSEGGQRCTRKGTLRQHHHLKRDGTPVSVPVWCAADNGTLLVFSEADSWKVKRIRRDAHVRLAPCSARGTPRGPAVDADASLVEETTTVQTLLARKYRWAWPAYRALMLVTAVIRRLRRRGPAPWLTIRITPR